LGDYPGLDGVIKKANAEYFAEVDRFDRKLMRNQNGQRYGDGSVGVGFVGGSE
jgi:hypothetical protein